MNVSTLFDDLPKHSLDWLEDPNSVELISPCKRFRVFKTRQRTTLPNLFEVRWMLRDGHTGCVYYFDSFSCLEREVKNLKNRENSPYNTKRVDYTRKEE